MKWIARMRDWISVRDKHREELHAAELELRQEQIRRRQERAFRALGIHAELARRQEQRE